jgi:SAM-dependent methyltransferase
MGTPSDSPPALDWSLGRYERIAEQFLPAARVLVESAALRPGERVVDVGCGTGNAALLAAALGARVIGVDPASRLLEVAREDAAARGLDAEFAVGDAAELPLDDGSADLVVSVFGVIFAPDPAAAVAELARVTSPSGRVVLSAWIPGGAISQAARMARGAIREARGAPPPAPPFAWHEPGALAELFAPYGFGEPALARERLAFTGPSLEDYLQAELENHPIWAAGRAILEPSGRTEELRERTFEILEAANEDPDGFRITRCYVVATLQR